MTARSAMVAIAMVVATACGDGDPAPGASGPSFPVPPSPSVSPPAGCSDVRGSDADAVVAMRSGTFVPGCLVVRDDQVVVLANEDEQSHTFTLVDPGGGVNPRAIQVDEELAAGELREAGVLGDGLGPAVYPFYCRFHQSQGMVGSLVLL